MTHGYVVPEAILTERYGDFDNGPVPADPDAMAIQQRVDGSVGTPSNSLGQCSGDNISI
jgi:hypothetical protein